jgi:acyl carrier protein
LEQNAKAGIELRLDTDPELDALDILGLMMKLKTEFEISICDHDLVQLQTVGQTMELVKKKILLPS